LYSSNLADLKDVNGLDDLAGPRPSARLACRGPGTGRNALTSADLALSAKVISQATANWRMMARVRAAARSCTLPDSAGDVLAVIEHGSGRVRILCATGHPAQSWVVQQARNLLMGLEDARTRVRLVLNNGDASFTQAVDAVVQDAEIVRSAVQAPRMNSVMEGRIGACRRDLLHRTLAWSQRHLMMVLRDYEGFYSTRRPHRARHARGPTRRRRAGTRAAAAGAGPALAWMPPSWALATAAAAAR
jgi:putative transposase